jgi:hypothetical protein
MTTGELIGLGMIITPIAFCAFMEWSYWHRHKRLVDYELHVRAQKREILEAIRLIQYGAHEEGIELLENSTLFKDTE